MGVLVMDAGSTGLAVVAGLADVGVTAGAVTAGTDTVWTVTASRSVLDLVTWRRCVR